MSFQKASTEMDQPHIYMPSVLPRAFLHLMSDRDNLSNTFNWFFEDFWVSRVKLLKQNTLKLLLAHTLSVVSSWLRIRSTAVGNRIRSVLERVGRGEKEYRRGALIPFQKTTLTVLQKEGQGEPLL
jgi:hypothetical protein